MKELLNRKYRNPELLAEVLGRRLKLKTFGELFNQLERSLPIRPSQFIPLLQELEEAIPHTGFPDKKPAPIVLRRLAWQALEKVARQTEVSNNPEVLSQNLKGLSIDQLVAFLSPIPNAVAQTSKFSSLLSSAGLQPEFSIYLEAALGYRFGIHSLFYNEEKGGGEVRYLWVVIGEKGIRSSFEIPSTEEGKNLHRAFEMAREAASVEGYTVFIDHPERAFEGPSLGLAIYLCLEASRQKKRISPGLAVTGALERRSNGWGVIRVSVFVGDQTESLKKVADSELDLIRRVSEEDLGKPAKFFASDHYIPIAVGRTGGRKVVQEPLRKVIAPLVQQGHRRFLAL